MFRFSRALPIEMDKQFHLRLHRHRLAAPERHYPWDSIRSLRSSNCQRQVELLEHGVPVASVATDAMGQYSIPRNPAPGSRLRVSVRDSPPGRPIDTTSNGAGVDFGHCPSARISFRADYCDIHGRAHASSPVGRSRYSVGSSGLSRARATFRKDCAMCPDCKRRRRGRQEGRLRFSFAAAAAMRIRFSIDGIPMNDIGGAVEFANIASAAVGQVEVLRGPNSALYGSDALAGVISLTTARGSTPLPLFSYLVDGGNLYTYHQEGTIAGTLQEASTTYRITPALIAAIRFLTMSITTALLPETLAGKFLPLRACAQRYTTTWLHPANQAQFCFMVFRPAASRPTKMPTSV